MNNVQFNSLNNNLTCSEIKNKLRLLRTEVRVKMSMIDELIEQWEILEIFKESDYEEEDI